MSELLILATAGIVGALLSGTFGYFARNRLTRRGLVLPPERNREQMPKLDYLSGHWHFYWISVGELGNIAPAWYSGQQSINVHGVLVQGRMEQSNGPRHYVVQGEIRAGRMLLTDTCLEDDTDYATSFYPNLRQPGILVGVWSGFDHRGHAISAPCVLSRNKLSRAELNQVAQGSALTLIPPSALV